MVSSMLNGAFLLNLVLLVVAPFVCQPVEASERIAAGAFPDEQKRITQSSQPVRRLIILSTNDRHSSLLGEPYGKYNPQTLGDGTQGGMARLKTLVDRIRAENPDTLLFDAGDFVDGTLFAVAQNSAADLNLMKRVGYDAACLGNHEFTYGPDGLARMLRNAQEPRLPLLCANPRFGPQRSDDALESLWGEPGEPGRVVHPWIVLKTASGIRVGAFGLIGEEVLVPEAWPVRFSIEYDAIQHLVNRLRQEQKADVVVLLMHGGVHESNGEISGEVADIARNVEGIDVIVAGHSHVQLQAQIPASHVPGSTWQTTIIEAGDGARFVGYIRLALDSANRVIPTQTETDILPVDDRLPGDPAIVELGEQLVADIERNYLPLFPRVAPLGVFGEVARVPFPLDHWNAAYLVTDALRRASKADFAVVSLGGDEVGLNTNGPERVVRVYDVFSAIRRGMGTDGRIGPPIYRCTLSLQEILMILEATTAYRGQMSVDYLLIPSGLRIVFDSRERPFQRIRKLVRLGPGDREEQVLYDDTALTPGAWQRGVGWQDGVSGATLFSVATTRLMLYGLRELNEALMEAGLLSEPILPRTADGVPVDWNEPEDLEIFLCRSEDGQEIRAWYSVAEMLLDAGGVIPAQYDDNDAQGTPHRRVWDVARWGMP